MGEDPAVVRYSKQSVAMPLTTQLWGSPCSGKVQQSVSCNAFDHSAMGEDPAVVMNSNQSVAMPLTTAMGEGPAVVMNSKQSVAMPLTTQLWGKALQW